MGVRRLVLKIRRRVAWWRAWLSVGRSIQGLMFVVDAYYPGVDSAEDAVDQLKEMLRNDDWPYLDDLDNSGEDS